MTEKLSGGVPEQGLREALELLVTDWYAYADKVGKYGTAGQAFVSCADGLRAALERPRPALPPDNRGIVGALQDLQEAGSPKRDYKLFLASGEALYGSKQAVQEAHWAIWRAEPTTTCTGQTYRDFAERCDRARQEAEQRAADATKLANELAGAPLPPQTGNPPPSYNGPVSETEATRALAIALADGFRAKGLDTTDAAAALIRERDELVEQVARLRSLHDY